MTSIPTVSVLMPVFNGERFLRESIESILNQSWRDFELIIVDDGSKDASAAIIGSYKDGRIVRETFPENRGLVPSLNRGLEIARGRYVARHDADDAALPQRLEKQVQFLDGNADAVVIGAAYLEIDENGNSIARVNMPVDLLAVRWHALFQNPFAHSTVMFRRSIVGGMGGYACGTESTYVEDYELWLRLMWSRERVANLSEPLVRWRANPSGVSQTFAFGQRENYRALVRGNLCRLSPGLQEQELVDLIWKLQVCGGFDESIEQVTTALGTLEDLKNSFCDYFQLSLSESRRLHDIADQRTARSLLHNAKQSSYQGELDRATELARLAVGLDKRLRRERDYQRLRIKTILGRQRTERLQAARKAINSTLHSA